MCHRPFFVAPVMGCLYYEKTVSTADVAQISANIRAVRERIAAAAKQVGRDPAGITLVAVSKTFPAEFIESAVAAGITDIGESRVQEGTGKIEQLGPIARWHLVGHLQSNKARRAVRFFNMIQSLDSLSLADRVSEEAARIGRKIDCLVEVNSSGEESKFGFPPGDMPDAAAKIIGLPGINLCGLMTIGPWTANEGCIREAFESTRRLFEDLQVRLGSNIRILSMGMSADYELAVACGSTMVRVGTAIFGKR